MNKEPLLTKGMSKKGDAKSMYQELEKPSQEMSDKKLS